MTKTLSVSGDQRQLEAHSGGGDLQVDSWRARIAAGSIHQVTQKSVLLRRLDVGWLALARFARSARVTMAI